MIQQTFTSIDMKLITFESNSETIGAKIFKINRIFCVSAVYLNDPKQTHRDKSEIYHDGLVLKIHKNEK